MFDESRQLNAPAPPTSPPGMTRGGTPVAGPAVPARRVPQLPPSLTTAPDPIGLLRALRRRWRLALGLGVLAAAIAGGAAWALVPRAQYTAKALLHVAARPPKILFSTVETEDLARDEYGRYQKTQVAWLKSRELLNSVLQQPRFSKAQIIRESEDPVQTLLEKLEVGFENDSELLSIKLSGDVPEELAALVNAIKDAYLERVVSNEHKKRLERYDMLKRHKEEYAESLKTKRAALKRLAETVGTDDRETLVLKQQFALEHLATIEKELLGVRSEKRKLEAELAVLDRAANGTSPPPQLSEADVQHVIDADPIVGQLQARLVEAEARLNRSVEHLRGVSRNFLGDPSLRKHRDEVALARRALDERRARLRPVVIEQLRGGMPRAEAQPGGYEIRQQMAILEQLEGQLVAEVEQLRQGSHSLNVNTLDLQAIQDEIEQVEATASVIGKEIESLNVELQANPRVTTIEDAVAPNHKSEKKRYMMIGMATMGAFAASLFAVSFLEFRTRKVDSADEVVMGLGMPLVGALPHLPSGARRGLSSTHKGRDRYWQALLLESVDATRTMILHAARTESIRVVMITSPLAGEGKTSLSCHLAISMARGGRRTLLLDGDLRSPSIDRLFDLTPGPGLSEVLRGETDLDGTTMPTMVEGLDVLPAGRCDDRSIRALTCGDLGPIFDRLKQRYDFVIVDSSPVLPAAEAQLIAQHADTALFSVLRHVSRMPKVFAAHQRLSSLGVPILGAVVTGAQGGLYGNDYRYPATSSLATRDAAPARDGGPS